MQYLAEVQIQKGLLGSKAQVKLIACQRGETWTAAKDEVIEISEKDAANLKDGALVLAEVVNNQVKGSPKEAGRPLVGILQNFSKLQDKFKAQEDEIEEWKQSLTFQAQELNRREMEMQARQEQLEQLEEEADKIEQQRSELETSREEAERLKEEVERNRQELEGAWEHLRGEQRRLEEWVAELKDASVLDEEQSSTLQELLNRLSGEVPPVESVREAINQALALMASKQQLLEQHQRQLEEQRTQIQRQQGEFDLHSQDLHSRWQAWHQAQEALDQARTELKAQQGLLTFKQDYSQSLSLTVRSTEELYHQLQQLAEASGQSTVNVDVTALEQMSMEMLQGIVQDLQRDLEKASGFVKDQEEELRLQLDTIRELEQKITAANEFDRLSLENELAGEQETYQFLNESLVGSRRNLGEREAVLRIHQGILRRRQGYGVEPGQEAPLNLAPILEQTDAQRQRLGSELQKLESEIAQMRESINNSQSLINSQMAEQDGKRNELKQRDQALQEMRSQLASLQSRVSLYEELIQPLQQQLGELKQSLETAVTAMSQVDEANTRALQTVSELRQSILGLTSKSPELAAS